jgi:hypothetical protein
LDLLHVHREQIEAWILEQAGIVCDAGAAPGALRVASKWQSVTLQDTINHD